MKELLEYDTYIFETDAFKEESIIRDEDGNELGRAVRSHGLLRAEVNLYDSQGKKWGRVKIKPSLSRGAYNFHDHNENIIAKMKPKIKSILKPSFWMEDPEGKKIYDVDSNWSGEKFKIKDKSGSIVAQIKQEVTGLTSSDYILKIINMNPLIALLIVPVIRIDKEIRS
ncbi:MAG: LURP-one-related family protein [Candidatus Lokiarchaeia archaeon]